MTISLGSINFATYVRTLIPATVTCKPHPLFDDAEEIEILDTRQETSSTDINGRLLGKASIRHLFIQTSSILHWIGSLQKTKGNRFKV